jgi:hypothetical protein
MKSKALFAVAVAGALSWSTAFAGPEGGSPSSADETSPGMVTLTSLDRYTGGFKGWGPIPNPQVPFNVDESMPYSYMQEMQENRQHLAEVRQAREHVWVANAPLRSEYENIGATRSRAEGSGHFFGR